MNRYCKKLACFYIYLRCKWCYADNKIMGLIPVQTGISLMIKSINLWSFPASYKAHHAEFCAVEPSFAEDGELGYNTPDAAGQGQSSWGFASHNTLYLRIQQ
jgi:hypothetical protein